MKSWSQASVGIILLAIFVWFIVGVATSPNPPLPQDVPSDVYTVSHTSFSPIDWITGQNYQYYFLRNDQQRMLIPYALEKNET
jgi:hypothetical protein